MKKLLLMLLALPMMALVSCSDDDTPNVDVTINYDNATVLTNGSVYVVKGDTLFVDSMYVTAVNKNHNASIVGPVYYSINNIPVARVVMPPYKLAIPTDSMAVGAYSLQFYMDVAEEQCTLGTCAGSVDLNIVNDSTEIPSDVSPTPGTTVIRN